VCRLAASLVTTKRWFSDYDYDKALVGFEGCLRRLASTYGVVEGRP